MISSTPLTTLVVVDPTVSDYQLLTQPAHPGTAVVVLDSARDGIAQISEALRQYPGIRSLQFLSHGEPGMLRLGATQLDTPALDRYAEQIRAWKTQIAQDADILLYGCRVAATAIGQAFVNALYTLTGANIAASKTLTGAAALGGDWRLDYQIGQVRSALAFPATALAAYPHVLPTVFLNETFTGTDVADNNWLFGIGQPATAEKVNPFLTAGLKSATDAAADGTIPGNPNPGVAPFPALDAPGDGALHLTNATPTQAAYVLYNEPFISNAGLQIEFDFFSYGGTGADGISFFLIDGAVRPTVAGGFGGSLGYAPIDDTEGIAGGYIGIGFDEFGNYSNPTFGRNGGPGLRPDAIAIRGSEASGYQYITGTDILPYSIDVPDATSREAARRRASIRLTPDGLLSVQVDANQDGDFDEPGETPPELQNIDIVAASGTALPETFTFGFGASTGAVTNTHEIRNLVISSLGDPPDTVDVLSTIAPGTTTNLVGLTGTDPDGTVESFTVLTLPPAEQGTLFLGDPAAGGTVITAGQVIPVAQIGQLFFQPTAGFTGGSFTYAATDNDDITDPTPATVTLFREGTLPPQPPTPGNQLPIAGNTGVDVNPGTVAKVPTIPATDPDGSVVSITITNLPPANQGQLFLGDPLTGGTPIRLGQVIPFDSIDDLYFQSTAGFTGSSFSYIATDNIGDRSGVGGVVLNNLSVIVDPDQEAGCKTGKRIRGKNRPNKLIGTPDRDTLLGQSKNDLLRGKACSDMLDGGGGNDRLFGGKAGDMLLGRPGRDRLFGERGNDTIIAGLGNDRADGGSGNDTIYGRRGKDRINGRAGNDFVVGGKDQDVLRGGANNDSLLGRQKNDNIRGGNGVDVIYGNIGRDRLFGERKVDTIFGGSGNDFLKGAGAADFLQGQRGADRLLGGTQADLLIGNGGNDLLIGGRADDTLRGGVGADTFRYQSVNQGFDTIFGFKPGKDKIDLQRIIRGSEYNAPNPFQRYIRLVESGSDTILRVDGNGNSAGGFRSLALLVNVSPDNLSASDFVL